MKPPSFEEILQTIQRDVTRVASHYPLVTGFFFPVMNQKELRDHYPWLLDELFLAVTTDIIMALGRLFEDTSNPRNACFATFLKRVEAHHKADTDVASRLKVRRAAFVKDIADWRAQITAIHKRLALRRNFDLAHNDLTKVGKSDIKWVEIKDMIAAATTILGRYFSAYHDTTQKFAVANVEWELQNFLEWCRLDDYASHRKTQREARHAAIEDWGRRRREGDPTAPDRPPAERQDGKNGS